MSKATKLPPLSLHSDTILRHFARGPSGDLIDDAALEGIRAAAAFGHETGKKMLAVHHAIMANEMATPIANKKRARDAALKSCEAVTLKVDAAVRVANAERNRILKLIEAPPKPIDISGHMVASEIRASFSKVSPSERRKLLDDAFASGEDEVISAILSGPAMTTGLTKTHKEAVRAAWQSKRYPTELDRARRLESAMSDILSAGSAFITFCNSLTNAELINAALRSEEAANYATGEGRRSAP